MFTFYITGHLNFLLNEKKTYTKVPTFTADKQIDDNKSEICLLLSTTLYKGPRCHQDGPKSSFESAAALWELVVLVLLKVKMDVTEKEPAK